MVKKTKKKRINSRAKGSTFERKIAKILSKWSNLEITKTPASGGYNSLGDVTPRYPKDMIEWPFNVELKNSETWNFAELLKGTNKGKDAYGIVNFWKQCVRDAKISKKIPVLVFTKNRDVIYCIVRSEHFELFKLKWVCANYFRFKNIRIFLFDDFLSLNYKKVLKILKAK